MNIQHAQQEVSKLTETIRQLTVQVAQMMSKSEEQTRQTRQRTAELQCKLEEEKEWA